MNPVKQARSLGQSIWLDNLSRDLLQSGALKQMIEDDGLSGVTSNPTIFQKAFAASAHYQGDLARLRGEEPDPERRFEALAIPDIEAACDLLRPVWEASGGDDGYVSLEVMPRLAHDAASTITDARRLAAAVARDNLLIKVPGTPAGVAAFEQLTAEGINVNVTLLFSLQQTVRIFEAYMRGLKARLAQGRDITRAKAVASLFLSRVDTLIDRRLEAIGTPEAKRLQGRAAVAMAKLAYQRYRDLFHGPLFAELRAAGARPQYLLWASTGTKNPAYPDLMYVEPLVGPETVNTLPDQTLAALREHGRIAERVQEGVPEAETLLVELERLGISLNRSGEELQTEGVRLFAESFDGLIRQVS